MNTFIQKQLLDYLIPSFEYINDDNFNSMIKKIVESQKMDAGTQRKRNDIIIHACNLLDQQLFNVLSLFQTMTYSQEINKGEIISTYLQTKACNFIDASLYQQGHTIIMLELENKNLIQENQRLKKDKLKIYTQLRSFSKQVARTKQLKQRQVSKIHSSIRKAKKIWPAQFRCAANKLFKINKKEYNASFVKLATDISNIGQTSIYVTVKCTRAIYQFLTGEMPQHWVTSKTLARWNKEIAALSLNQNLPKDTSSRFFGYGIMADESTRGEKKILIICFSYWDANKLKPTITIVKVTDITRCNAETVSTTVFEMCKEKGIDPQKYHYWVTDNTAYMSSEANGAIAKFNSLAISQSFRIPCGLHATHIALINFENMAFEKLDSIKELSLKKHSFNLLNLAFHLHDRYNFLDKDSLLNLKSKILKKLYKAIFNFEMCKYQQPIRQWWLYELKTAIQYLDRHEVYINFAQFFIE
ncbi:546_t:CDS:1 [Racocetra persica]|uniref:546_t:CDS:1 n=1 Tax=Racocetra persica TaxID=160502 RepID=A0ACA9QKW3_9GLOM|nr:546_t:CDS:1 [Racocetra persica]